MTKHGVCLAALISLGWGCVGDDVQSDEAFATGKQICKSLPVSAEPLDHLDDALDASRNVPLPSYGPDAEGSFHPPRGYMEGGTYEAAEDRPEWQVADDEIAPPAPAGALRTVEWNVARGNKLAAVIQLMKRVNADVWILNETDFYGHNSGDVVVAREMARALGYSYVSTIEFYERRDDRMGASGNAIVSRYPLFDPERADVPILEEQGGLDWADSLLEPRCGQRGAVAATIDAPTADGTTTPVRVVAAHLENFANSGVRRKQYESAVGQLVDPGAPTVLAGDFNTLAAFEGRGFRKYLKARLQAVGSANAFFDCSRDDNTDTFGGSRIDWMLVQSGGQPEKLECPVASYRVLDAAGASDHKPVLTELQLR